jgi:hypothetical protein
LQPDFALTVAKYAPAVFARPTAGMILRSQKPRGCAMVAADQLRKIMPNCSFLRITAFAPWLNKTMDEFHINSEPRITAFLAQIAHESCELRYVEEIASGRAYEGRKDLGNLHHGDGVKYKGRGLLPHLIFWSHMGGLNERNYIIKSAGQR